MKLKIAITILAFTIAFSSCRKNYICNCNDNGTKYEFYSAPTKYNKSEAKVWCNNYTIASGWSCSLK